MAIESLLSRFPPNFTPASADRKRPRDPVQEADTRVRKIARHAFSVLCDDQETSSLPITLSPILPGSTCSLGSLGHVPMSDVNPSPESQIQLVVPDVSGFRQCLTPPPSDTPVMPDTPVPAVPYDAFRLKLQRMLDKGRLFINGQRVLITEQIGSGDFNDVYLLSNRLVAKFPKDLQCTKTKKIVLARTCAKRQYQQLQDMKEILAAINLGILPTVFRADGVIVQPFSKTVVCSWDKTTSMEQLSKEDWALLETAKRGFDFFFRQRTILADFKPSNLAIDPENPQMLLIRDFYELNDDGDEFSMLVRSLLRQWARGNPEIYKFLAPSDEYRSV